MTLYEFIKLVPDHWPHPDESYSVDYHDDDYALRWIKGEEYIAITILCSGNLEWHAFIDSKEIQGKTTDIPKEIPKDVFDIFTKLGFDKELN